MSKNANKGFTLIELLVVIAIIGILAAIVLASLGQARQSARDAAAVSAMSSVRAEAELYFTSTNTYSGVCADDGVERLLQAAAENVGSTDTSFNDGTQPRCNDSANEWAAEVNLNADNAWFCVDSIGFAGRQTATSTADFLSCA